MEIIPDEAHYFKIIPTEAFNSKHIKEVFDLVKKGDVESVKEVLNDAYDRSTQLIKTYKYNYQTLFENYE